MDSINRKRRKTYPRKNNHQIFLFWIICFELTIIGNSKQITKKEKMEHNILKSLQPLFNQGLESYDVHNYSLIHIPIPSNIQLLNLLHTATPDAPNNQCNTKYTRHVISKPKVSTYLMTLRFCQNNLHRSMMFHLLNRHSSAPKTTRIFKIL